MSIKRIALSKINFQSVVGSKSFGYLNRYGVKFVTSYFVLFILKLNESAYLSGGFVKDNSDDRLSIFTGIRVSKKFDKRAVFRNKARRRAKHVITDILRKMVVDTDLAVLFIPRRFLANVDFEILRETMQEVVLKFIKRDMIC